MDSSSPLNSQIFKARDGLKRILQIENNSDFDLHPEVNAFITTYQALPILARAKVENWLISLDDIKELSQDTDLSGTYPAVFHGSNVSSSSLSSNVLQ